LVDSTIITTTEGYASIFGCYLLVGDITNIGWTWSFGNSALSQESRISWTNATNNSIITVANTASTDDGTYVCNATNSFGSHSRSTRVRIKSKPSVLTCFSISFINSKLLVIIKGKLAPLWPVLGLFGEIALLAAFIAGHWVITKKKDMKKVDTADKSNK
jgi:hypothetical protein